jgi:hypothetical protein
LLLMSDNGSGEASCSFIPKRESYGYCLEEKARALEPSGESASDVASAAISACSGTRARLVAYFNSCGRDGLAIAQVMDPMARDDAIKTVVEIRARRHAGSGLRQRKSAPSN